MTEPEFNLFELIDLDPSGASEEDVKQRVYEQLKWANRVSQTDPPALLRRAELLKIHERRMLEVAVNADDRRKHAAQYTALRKNKLLLAANHVKLLEQRGHYTETDVQEIGSQCGLRPEEVKKLIEQAGLKPLSSSSGARVSLPPRTDATVARSIEEDLRVARVPTLYDFLGLGNGARYGRNSSPRSVEARYRELEEALRQLTRGTPEHNRDSRIMGHVKTHLLDSAAREKYDNYLDLRPLEQTVKGLIDTAGRATKALTREAFEQIVRMAQGLGVSAATAETFVRVALQEKKWLLLQSGNEGPVRSLPTCGFCGAVSPIESKQCTACGQPLFVSCPSCARLAPSGIKCCPGDGCGFPIGDLSQIDPRMRAVDARLNTGDLDGAERLLIQIEQQWPRYKPAVERRKGIEQQREEQRRRQSERLSRIGALRNLVSDGKLMEAAALLDQLGDGAPPAPNDLVLKIREGLAEADKVVAAARQAAISNPSYAVTMLQNALKICCDHRQALRELQQLPPSPPRDLKCAITASCVRLAWKAADGETGIRFLVVRKAGGGPASASDGTVVCTVDAPCADDPGAAIGTPWYYAVFAVRSGVATSRAALAGPCLLMGKPAVIEKVAVDSAVRLRWKSPPGCERVSVLRDGSVMLCAHGSEVEDLGLRDGTTYAYRLWAVYRNPATGEEMQSDAVEFSLTPQRTPQPVTDLTLSVNGRSLEARWTAPAVGRVVIRQMDHEPQNWRPGQLLDLNECSVGAPVPFAAGATNVVMLPMAPSGLTVLVPFTVNGSVAVVGKWQQHANLPEVTNLRVRMLGTSRYGATWDWPEAVEQVVVTCFGDVAMTHPVMEQVVTRSGYAHGGGMVTLQGLNPPPCAIRVQTVCGGLRSGGAVTRGGAGTRGVVRYRVRQSSSFARFLGGGPAGPCLVLESADCTQLRGLQVVGAVNRVPMDRRDGRLIMDINEVRFFNGCAEVPLHAPDAGPPLYLKVFLLDKETAALIQLESAGGKETVRLGGGT